jgi:hypothetical protein
MIGGRVDVGWRHAKWKDQKCWLECDYLRSSEYRLFESEYSRQCTVFEHCSLRIFFSDIDLVLLIIRVDSLLPYAVKDKLETMSCKLVGLTAFLLSSKAHILNRRNLM